MVANNNSSGNRLDNNGLSRINNGIPLDTPINVSAEICGKASRYAVRVCQEMSKRSQLINDIDDVVPSFEREEVIPYVGDLLGKGGFNNVYELERIELSNTNALEKQRDARKYVANSINISSASSTSKSGSAADRVKRFAIKFLSDEAMGNADEFCNGAADLLMEAKYLSALAKHYHPGLIQLHGVAASGAVGFAKGYKAGYFLIIDRLYDTLDKKIEVWKELKKRKSSYNENEHPNKLFSNNSGHNNNSSKGGVSSSKLIMALYLQRIIVAMDIASALRHLHKLQIVFRDLKPDNVGFDYDGHVKLFDFGLAKELDPLQKLGDNSGLYKMSGGTGSRRFMAPEVALSEPYTLSADIYSFAILLWEIIALSKAYGDLSQEEHRERVVKGKERPSLKSISESSHNTQPKNQQHHNADYFSPTITTLLNACWSRYEDKRPSAKEVYKSLKQEVSYTYEDISSS